MMMRNRSRKRGTKMNRTVQERTGQDGAGQDMFIYFTFRLYKGTQCSIGQAVDKY